MEVKKKKNMEQGVLTLEEICLLHDFEKVKKNPFSSGN